MIRAASKIFIAALLLAIVSCTGLKRLPPGEKLYTGANIHFVKDGKVAKKTELRSNVKKALKPAPNEKFLGMRLKLWAWQNGSDAKKKGLKKKLRERGEPPVLLSQINPASTAKVIEATLFNSGIFNGKTTWKVEEKKKTAVVHYTCYIHAPYTISEYKIQIADQHFREIIESEMNKSIVRIGDNYSLNRLKDERDRLDQQLKNNGYFYFNSDYLVFKADTFMKGHTIRIHLQLKPDLPEEALRAYKINRIFIYSTSTMADRSDSVVTTGVTDSIIFVNPDLKTRPKVILESILLKNNQLYSRKHHNNTLSRLMNLGIYKFVRLNFQKTDSAEDRLDLIVLLTTKDKRSIRYEMDMVSKSNDFVGPQFGVDYTNRNTFNGAELLNLSFSGSFETQLSGKYKNLFSYSFEPRVQLLFPRFLVPFRMRNSSTRFVPKSQFSTAYSFLNRVGYFRQNSIEFLFGYKWRETILKEHEFNPLNINVVHVTDKTPEFEQLLAEDPYLQKSYEEQFIFGMFYSYIYNEQVLPFKKNQVYLNFTTETSGNAFSLFHLAAGNKPSPENPQKIFGQIYSQFTKLTVDTRNYVNFKYSKFVQRLFLGVGKSYGNSNTLPYIKQFFCGGPNGIRAFPINSLGPGTDSTDLSSTSLFVQQGGDIKMEGNLEYRFDILKYTKGAVFVDAGNTWLFKNNPSANGNSFGLDTWFREIGVGTGLGIRFDIQFFVLRLDLAMPLRKPWYPQGQRWVINEIDFSDPQWRSDNLIFNLAIGYPF